MHHTHRFYLWVSRGLALLLMITLGLGLIRSAQAQNVAPGYVIGWGWNINGQLDIPPGLSDVVAVSASQIHSMALRSTGEVVAWGNDYGGAVTVPAAAKSGVTAIAAGSSHSLAIKNGVVLAWGCGGGDDYGQCTVPTAAKSGVTAIAAGDFHSLALKNGQVIAWGCPTAPLNYNWGQCDVPTVAQSGVTAIAAGDTFSIALRGDRVYSWGSGCSVPNSALSGVVAIAAGGSSAHCLAIKSDGTVIAWGNNEWGQIDVPADLKNAATSHVVAIATGYGHSVAVKNDGTVVAWADDYAGRIDVPAGLTGVTAVAASWHNLVIVPAPRVTINQAAGQADPATTTPIQFTATFTRPVTNFTAADVTLSGTANRTNAVITISGGPSVYTISVNGVSGSGTVIATIAAGVATDAVGVPNLASTSTDNSVSLLADTLPPVANPTQSPLAAPSGWNNTNVTVTWSWTDPTTGPGPTTGIDAANCTTSSVSSGSGTINLSATCKDLAGNTGTATYQVRVDPTAPTANPSQSPAANGAGWNNSNVTVNWNWVSTGAIIDTANCTTSLTSSGEGTLTLSATCKDVALNQRTVPYTVKVDKTAPVVTVTGVSNGATYTVGSVPTAACGTTDGVSGVATVATLSSSGGNPDGTGSFTVTCSGATDVAGNSAAPTSVSYTVNALINSSVSQQSVSAVYNATPQACPSSGGSLPFHSVTPTLRNTTSTSFSGLFFKVKTLEYTTAQSGQPVLCNATSGNGGVGSTFAIPNSSLPGGNSQFNPGEDLVPTFQIGLPVRTQYRFFVDLYAVGAVATADGTTQAGEYLGSFVYTFDAPPATSGTTRLFLPLINR